LPLSAPAPLTAAARDGASDGVCPGQGHRPRV